MKNTSVRITAKTHGLLMELKGTLEKECKTMISLDKTIEFAIGVAKKDVKKNKNQLLLEV